MQSFGRFALDARDGPIQKLRAGRTCKSLDRADFTAQGRGFEKQSVIAGERYVREHVLQILGEAQSVGRRRQQSEDSVECVFRAYGRAIVGGEPDEEVPRDVERTMAGAIVMQGKA